MYKLFSFDVDGTLFSYEKDSFGISENTIQMLKNLKDKGYCLVMNSGRSWNDIPKELFGLFQFYILNNGGLVCDKDALNYANHPISKDEVIRFVTWCKKNQKSLILKTKYNSYYQCFDGKYPEYLYYDNGVQFLFEKVDINKSSIYTINLDLEQHELKMLKELFPSLIFSHGGFNYYEVYSQQADKNNALKKLLVMLNVKMDEVIAFGDSMNDYEILSNVGLGVAMKDGHPDLLDKIKEKCEPISKNGIEKYLKENRII